MEVHTEPISNISINHAENLAVTSSTDKKLRVFSVENNSFRFLYELLGHKSEIVSAIFVAGTDMIASADFAGNLLIWAPEDKQYMLKQKIEVLDGVITSLAGRFDNNIVVFCGCSDGKIRSYEIKNHEHSMTEMASNDYGIACISCNDEYLLSGGIDLQTNLYADGKLIASFGDHEDRINDVALCPSNQFNVLFFASCSSDKTVMVYAKKKDGFAKQRILVGEECYQLRFSKAGFCLTVGYGNNSFKAYLPDESGQFKEVDVEDVSK